MHFYYNSLKELKDLIHAVIDDELVAIPNTITDTRDAYHYLPNMV